MTFAFGLERLKLVCSCEVHPHLPRQRATLLAVNERGERVVSGGCSPVKVGARRAGQGCSITEEEEEAPMEMKSKIYKRWDSILGDLLLAICNTEITTKFRKN